MGTTFKTIEAIKEEDNTGIGQRPRRIYSSANAQYLRNTDGHCATKKYPKQFERPSFSGGRASY
jgi:hypothetical protein